MFRARQRQRGGSVGGSAPFTPASISGLGAWYDASDASSITIATGVSQWNDKSGNNRHLTQATGANQPAYSGTGSTSAVTFDGTNDYLSNALPFMINAGACSAFLVAQIADKVGMGMLGEYDTGSLFNNIYRVYRRATGGAAQLIQVELFNNAGGGGFSTQLGSWVCWDGANSQYTITDSGTLVSGWRNGTPAPSTQAYARSGVFSPNIFGIGADLAGTPSAFVSGIIREIIIYTRDLTSAERLQVQSYQKAKWGTP